MLAIVKTAHSTRTPLKYNEQKIGKDHARLLDAHNFWQQKEDLTTRDKWRRFHNLSILNQRSQRHGVHISLNFSPMDQLSDQKMTGIATAFMERIGFGEQPWLVYRHVDAGHPHMHIVTTNIRPDGSRIPNDLRSPHHLKQICFAIEKTYDLTPALPTPGRYKEQHASAEHQSRITYGRAPTKAEITRVLDHIVHRYAFTSLDSLNAILGQYHLHADRGRKDNPMYRNNGLYYRVIDEKGKHLVAPIKASALPLPVTLPKLEEKFRENEAKLREQAQLLRSGIEWGLAQGASNLGRFKDNMRRDGIAVIGDDRGFFYIDHRSGTVARDKELGEQYTAAAILKRMPAHGQELELGIHRDRGLDLSR